MCFKGGTVIRNSNYNYEYSSIRELSGLESKYIFIPKTIITNSKLGNRRVALISYLLMNKGLNDEFFFSIPSFLEWSGYKSDSHAGATNDKVLKVFESFVEIGYISCLNKKQDKNTFNKMQVNSQLIYEETQKEFALLYLDEIEKIMQYKSVNKKDTSLNNFSVLLVFSYLRNVIKRRSNELNPEERTPEGIVERKKRIPEAYNCALKDISISLGLTDRTVSKAIKILVDLKLIVMGEAYRIKNECNEYRTPYFIFANFEKRYKNELLAFGREYACAEIQQQANNINNNSLYNYNLKRIEIAV